MKDEFKLGQIEATQQELKKDSDKLEERVEALELHKTLQDLAIARCSAIWGFIVIIATTIGGFVSYNFVKVKLALIAAFRAFNGN